MDHRRVLVRCAAVGAIAGAGLAATGCGGDSGSKHYKNTARPPDQITVTAAVSDRGVSVSPKHVGAGPVRLIVTNLTDQPRSVQFTSPAGGRGSFDADSGEITPSGTQTVRADVPEGDAYVRSGTLSARLVVGPRRPSAQNDLLLP